MKIRSIAGCWLILFCFFLLSTPQAGRAQKVENQEIFSPKEMNKRWETFSTDKAFLVLLKEVRAKGFTRKKDPKASWGFKGTAVSEKGEKDDALFCIFDLDFDSADSFCLHDSIIRYAHHSICWAYLFEYAPLIRHMSCCT